MSLVEPPSEERRIQVLKHWELAQQRLTALLFEEDPAGLVSEAALQADEYELEATNILPRLPACKSEHEVQVLIHQKMHDLVDVTRPKPLEAYSRVAKRVWLEVVPVLREGGIPCSTAL